METQLRDNLGGNQESRNHFMATPKPKERQSNARTRRATTSRTSSKNEIAGCVAWNATSGSFQHDSSLCSAGSGTIADDASDASLAVTSAIKHPTRKEPEPRGPRDKVSGSQDESFKPQMEEKTVDP